jgi:hypothetical protein
MSINIEYGTKHRWKQIEGYQWSRHCNSWECALSVWECQECFQWFRHYYHVEPNIYLAMRRYYIMRNYCVRPEYQSVQFDRYLFVGQRSLEGWREVEQRRKCPGSLYGGGSIQRQIRRMMKKEIIPQE